MRPDELPPDFRKIFATVFENIGSVKSLTQWAKTHKTIFYSSMFKTLPQQIDSTVTHRVDGDEARQKLQSAFLALINAERQREGRDRLGQDREISKTPVIIDNVQAPAPQPPERTVPQLVAAKPAPPDDGITKPPKPDVTTTRHVTPAEARERAAAPMFPTPPSNEPSTTEQALAWMGGKGRMRWEPPSNW
jgi:hypothetical protein